MKASQFYKYAAIVLFVLNLLVLAFVFWGPKGPPPMGPGQGAQEMLQLDDQQHEAFLKLAEVHSEAIKELEKEQRRLLRPYFNSLTDATAPSDLDALMQGVQLAERRKITLTYQHFQEIKLLLRPEQQPAFKGFMNHMLKILLLEQQQHPKPPKGK
ncbi:MAG: hypothetical protein AAGG75_23150 [Bacteroidota bacterium]